MNKKKKNCTSIVIFVSLYRTNLLEKLTLRSQRSILKKDIHCYSVAGVYDGKFCISSLQDAHSFSPSHEHKEKVKKSNTEVINSGKFNNANILRFVDDNQNNIIYPYQIVGSESSDDETESGITAIPITVKFTHKNNDKTKLSQEVSHQQHLMRTAEEPWCETAFYNSTSSTAMVRSKKALMSFTIIRLSLKKRKKKKCIAETYGRTNKNSFTK